MADYNFALKGLSANRAKHMPQVHQGTRGEIVIERRDEYVKMVVFP
jgi:hypothetical protein